MTRFTFRPDFVERISKEFSSYGDRTVLRAVENGEVQQIRDVLSFQSMYCASAQDIIEAFKKGEERLLLEKAERSLRIRDLLDEIGRCVGRDSNWDYDKKEKGDKR